jgi:hypothetical protein
LFKGWYATRRASRTHATPLGGGTFSQSKSSEVCSPLSGLYSVAPLYLFLLALLIQKQIPIVNPGGLLGAALSSIDDHQGEHKKAATRKWDSNAIPHLMDLKSTE